MVLNVNLLNNSYDIVIEKGILQKAGDELDLNRKVLIVTDSLVPDIYAKTVASFCKTPVIKTVKSGEESKSILSFEELLKTMLENGFSRHDAVVAVGGGVVGDLAGFSASCYMRGIDFYNIPTTLLSQVDSSIGGKTAVNLENVKNIVGTFYQPKKVLIDPDVLQTLPKRHLSNGLAEAIKMALTCDKELFELLETKDIYENLETIIEKSLNIKRNIVQQDEKEQNLRKVLNFGHTLGHGIEAVYNLYHGECVALGMLPMCTKDVRERLIKVLKKADLPVTYKIDKDKVLEVARYDKKADSGMVDAVFVGNTGTFDIRKTSYEQLKSLLSEVF